MRRCYLWALVICLGIALPAAAVPREARLPLRNGVLHTDDLIHLMTDQFGLRAFNCPIKGQINLTGMRGSLLIRALDQSLGEGFDLRVEDATLIVRVDPAKLPTSIDEAKAAARIFTATAAPQATAEQQALYGLRLPADLDPAKPLVVLIHGLDSSKGNWQPIANLLQAEGHQVAWFTFPSDQPIADSANLLSQHLEATAEIHPTISLNLLAFSMGSLVARAAIESPDFKGNVERLIMIAPPNHGSDWARYRLLLEVHEHYHLARAHEQWHWTWMITDGLGEAGRDLKPGSSFIQQLNGYKRRDGVAYTIIAGNQHSFRRITANCIAAPLQWTPASAEQWWGIRQTRLWLEEWSQRIRNAPDSSDGPVKLHSANLEGVEDFVVLPVDHNGLYQPVGEDLPAAWPVIRDRLGTH